MTQALASILFFYVFGMLAIVLTWYIALSIYRYFKEPQRLRSLTEKEPEPKK